MKSGPTAEPLPMEVRVLALEPCKGKTPWWVRRGGFTYSHLALVVGGWVWSQPWKGRGRCVPIEDYLKAAGPDRGYLEVSMYTPDHSPEAWELVCDLISNRKTQRVRSVLRHLRLWPRPAWNCTTPVRYCLAALGLQLEGETPDAIITELEHTSDHIDDQPPFGRAD